MKKVSKKFLQIIMLISVIFSSIQTPLYVLADTITPTETPEKGDMRLGNDGEITKEGTITVPTVGSADLNTAGNVQVTKTVTAVEGEEGKYQVQFFIQGKKYLNVTNTTKDSYTVFVLDASGSMRGDPWNNAVPAAISFSEDLVDAGANNYISLVTFNSNGYQKRDFANEVFTTNDFGSINTGTNYEQGLNKAYDYLNALSDTVKQNASLNIIFISDGEPNRGSYSTILSTIKGMGVNIYTFAYNLNPQQDRNAYQKLQEISTNNTVTSIESDNIDSILSSFVEQVTIPTPAGTNATLTDGIGNEFKIVTTDNTDISGYGIDYQSEVITEITEEGTTLTFYIQINKDAATGWYETNEGFKLTYTDISGQTPVEKEITCNQNPQVYWVQNQYDYIVNYYKDSINESNLLASETRQAPNGTIIDITNVDKDKYLQTAGDEYELSSITPESITITNNGEVKTINVLYTIKKYNYNVNYYYDNVLDTELSQQITNVPHGTIVSSEDYYLETEDIKEGYKLDVINTDKGNITIDSSNKVINIYYIKDSFEYTINYHFNQIIDSKLTINNEATYKDIIKAEDNILTTEKLQENNYSDYFLHPVIPYDKNQIEISTNKENNILNIYYINTFVEEETIDKTSTNQNITSSQDIVKYQVEYTSTIKNIKKDETIIVTITDTLPYEIDESKSNLNGGIYSNKTITWTFEEIISEFKEEYTINKTINYEVVYKDFANLSSKENNNLVNNVEGKTTVANKTTQGVNDSTQTPVEIDGKLITEHVDEYGNDLLEATTTIEKVGTSYQTEKETIYGYTFKEVKGNETGLYQEEDTTVTYIYTKNDGNIKENEVTKAQINPILGTTSTFKYVLTYNGEIENYIGNATITLEDTLPYEVASINYPEGCTYDENTRTLTCTKTETLTKEDTKINATFEIVVTYKNLVSEIDLEITNIVKSTLTYGKNTTNDTDEVTDKVLSGKVTANYVDTEGNTLSDSIITSGLVDTDYKTNKKTIYGYTLNKVEGNETGKYQKEDIIVTYIYTKNAGTTETNEVTKEGPENIESVNGVFNYTLTYNGKITDYIGNATLTLTDTLPYVIDEELSTYDNRCTYNNKVLTCTDTYEINEETKEINDSFKLSLVFKNVDSEKVTNVVESTLDYGKNTPDKDKDETETEVFKGTVIANYVDTEGNTLSDSITTTGLANTDYETSEKTIYGYTFKEVNGEKIGKYIANETIYVEYIYTKNAGTTETNEVTKEGPENIESVNGIFNYTLTYNGKITDYVGNATLTLTDTLPYEIDEELSTYDNRCTYNNKVLTCTDTYEINEETKEINDSFKLSLVFKNVDSEKVTNVVESTLDYGKNTPDKDKDETETEVFKGTVIATYKNTEGQELAENIIKEDLAGNEYQTEEQEFLGYTLTKVPTNQNGKYLANETIYVDYIYEKNVGTSEEVLEKEGQPIVSDILAPFEYNIRYNLEVFDYVGEVKITLTDHLPYEIDEEKSIIGDVCEYINGTLVCNYLYNITNKENSKISIEENLVLYYKNITSNKVINRIESVVIYGDEEKIDEDNYLTEIPYGTLIVNYVTDKGISLSQTIVNTDLVGKEYTTEQKTFDNYYFKEVIGESTGVYKEDVVEVTYIYSEIPLPPQTGVEGNIAINYVSIILLATILLVLKRRYI